MPPQDESQPVDLTETTIEREDGEEVPITLRDAEEMKRALESFLASPQLEEQQLPVDPPPYVGTAVIVGPGDVRVGSWILSSRGQDLVLVHRPRRREARFGYQLVAYLEGGDGQWKVTKIHFVRVEYG